MEFLEMDTIKTFVRRSVLIMTSFYPKLRLNL